MVGCISGNLPPVACYIPIAILSPLPPFAGRLIASVSPLALRMEPSPSGNSSRDRKRKYFSWYNEHEVRSIVLFPVRKANTSSIIEATKGCCMKLGFLTANSLDIEKAARLGFQAVELNVDALGKIAEGPISKDAIAHVRQLSEKHGIEITALASYGAAFNPVFKENFTAGYERVFAVAEGLGIHVIASMAGFDANRDWKGNIQLFADRFGPVAERAEQRGLQIAFENWMGFGGHLPFKPVNL